MLGRVGEEGRVLDIVTGRKRIWLGHCKTQGNVVVETLDGLVNGKWNRGGRRDQMIDVIE